MNEKSPLEHLTNEELEKAFEGLEVDETGENITRLTPIKPDKTPGNGMEQKKPEHK